MPTRRRKYTILALMALLIAAPAILLTGGEYQHQPPIAPLPAVTDQTEEPQPTSATAKAGISTSDIDGPTDTNQVQTNLSLTAVTDPTPVAQSTPDKPDAYQPVDSPFVQEELRFDTIVADDQTEYPLRIYDAAVLPNDPSVNQWWVTQPRLDELWDTNTGSSSTVLAIIDTGFALDHEEFQGRWHTNTAEQGSTAAENPSLLNCTDQSLSLDRNCNLIDDNYDGIVDNESGTTTEENPSQLNCTDQSLTLDKSCNLVDDDANGLVDDWRGWDFVNFDRSVQAGEIDPLGDGVRHGTYVTGVAAANANNSVGIAGVNWNTKVLPIQALADSGSGTSIGVARAIRYAVDQGADVISMSLGSFFPDSFIRQTVQEAMEAGVIVVAAAGNDGCNCMSYPANYPEVVAVGSLNQSDGLASHSSYGANLDILAPGVSLYTTSWSPSNQTAAYTPGVSGTSLATPVISGLITSLVSADPTASPIQILAALHENTNRLDLGSTTPHSITRGFGAADAYAANQRFSTVYSPDHIVSLDPVSDGSFFNSSSPAEPAKTTLFYQCELPDMGTTPLYYISNGTFRFFSASHAELYQAQQSGYSHGQYGNLCVLQDHDTPSQIRILNTFSEFLVNIPLKQP